jgi:hypothetical protein
MTELEKIKPALWILCTLAMYCCGLEGCGDSSEGSPDGDAQEDTGHEDPAAEDMPDGDAPVDPVGEDGPDLETPGDVDVEAPDDADEDGGGLSDLLVPAHGALLGLNADYQRGSPAEVLPAREAQIGRQVDIYHAYHRWRDDFPTAYERQAAEEGRILLLNWKGAVTGGTALWAAIADGDEDAQIETAAERIGAFGHRLFLAFHHEPEDEARNGEATAEEYAAAYRRIHDMFGDLGVTNVVWVWNVMGFSGHEDLYTPLYPGDAYVDWLAHDPYNWYGCRDGSDWRNFNEITQWFYDWSWANHPDKPVMLAEFGLEEHDALSPTKADWLREALPMLVRDRPRIRAVVYVDTGEPDFCAWSLDSSPESLAAFADIAADPYLNPVH